MTAYTGLLLTSHDSDVLAVNAELAKGDEGVDLGLFYSDPVPILNPGGNVIFWHVLVTFEQYEQRKAEHKPMKSFKSAPASWKNSGKPFHVFGRGIHPTPEELAEEEEPEEIL